MKMEAQVLEAQVFPKTHDRSLVFLRPNVRDVGSTRLSTRHGSTAIATTSGGPAWLPGYADGEQAPQTEVLAAIARITRVAELSVTADVESDYGNILAAVDASVRTVIAVGAVSISIRKTGLPSQRHSRSRSPRNGRTRPARDRLGEYRNTARNHGTGSGRSCSHRIVLKRAIRLSGVPFQLLGCTTAL